MKLLNNEMSHLSEEEDSDGSGSGSDGGDLAQKFPFSPLPKHSSGTMVDKSFSETGKWVREWVSWSKSETERVS